MEVKLYLSDEDIRKLNSIIDFGGGAAAVYGGLVEAGVLSGSLANPYTAVLGGVVLAYIGWINWSNSGCGVVLSATITPVGWSGVWVNSQ
jgi:hypothetical protein